MTRQSCVGVSHVVSSPPPSRAHAYAAFNNGCIGFAKNYLIERHLQPLNVASWIPVAATILVSFTQFATGVLPALRARDS